jgi:hypothetical protein
VRRSALTLCFYEVFICITICTFSYLNLFTTCYPTKCRRNFHHPLVQSPPGTMSDRQTKVYPGPTMKLALASSCTMAPIMAGCQSLNAIPKQQHSSLRLQSILNSMTSSKQALRTYTARANFILTSHTFGPTTLCLVLCCQDLQNLMGELPCYQVYLVL